MFIAREEKSAFTLARVESDESKMAIVAFNGAGCAGVGCRWEGDGDSTRSGYDIDGNEDANEDGISSHFWESSAVSVCDWLGGVILLSAVECTRACSPVTRSLQSAILGEPPVCPAVAETVSHPASWCTGPRPCTGCADASACCCSARMASHRALSFSAFSRASADCARHLATWASYSALKTSDSEEDDDSAIEGGSCDGSVVAEPGVGFSGSTGTRTMCSGVGTDENASFKDACFLECLLLA